MAVNLSPVFGVAGQLFNDNGDPLAGGKIFTYLAGTTTSAATYTSSSGTIPHTNPIILDGAGRVPSGEIWLTDGITYKFVVQDSANNLIGTYDNLVGINSNFVNFTNSQEIQTATAGQTVFNLTTMQYQPGTNSLSVFVDGVNQYGPGAQYAYVETDSNTVTFVSGLHVGASVKFTTSQVNGAAATDAEQVSYNPPFTDGVPTNVEAKLAEMVSVKDFGAVGDGVTDDTTAIQNALASGQNIYFPPGVYMHTGGLVQSAIGQHVYGAGIKILPQPLYPIGNATILKKISGTSDAYELACNNGGMHNIAFDNNGLGGAGLKITGHYLEVENIAVGEVGGTSYAIELESVNVSNFDTINFFGTIYGGIRATGVDACLYSSFSNVIIENTTAYNLDFENVANSSFDNFLLEKKVIFRSGCASLYCNNWQSEYGGTNDPWIEITDPIQIIFNNIKFSQQVGLNRTAPIFKLKDSRNCAFYNLGIFDSPQTVNPIIWEIDGTFSTIIENVWYFGYQNSTFIECVLTGGFNLDVNIENIRQFGTGTGNCNWLVGFDLNVENAHNITQNFYNAFSNTTINMTNVSSKIDTTNLPSTTLVHFDTCADIDDLANVAFVTNSKSTQGYRVDSGRFAYNLLSVGTGATATWVGAIPKNAIVKSVTLKNNGVVTGAVGFTGYDAGYTGDTNAFGTNTGSNNAELIPKDYTITTPFYNKENGAADIILTANGGNFASGAVNIYLVYELVGNPI